MSDHPWRVYALLLNSVEPAVEAAGGIDNATHNAFGSHNLQALSSVAFEDHGNQLQVESAVGERLLDLNRRAWELAWDLDKLVIDLGLMSIDRGEPFEKTPLGDQALEEMAKQDANPMEGWDSYATDADGALVYRGRGNFEDNLRVAYGLDDETEGDEGRVG